MSKRGPARRSSAPTPARDTTTDPEAIAMRIHRIAAAAGALAVVSAPLNDHGPSLSHALFLIEENLLEIEQRVERLRRV